VLVPFMGGITFLPFIRDSKLPDKVAAGGASAAAKPTKEVASNSAPAPVVAPKAPAAPVPAAVPSVATVAAAGPKGPLADKINVKGEEIRVLKASKVFWCLLTVAFFR